ncbi:PepSY domain-containing protein [Alkalicoccobacillus murimartini]|uniref:Membrane protein YkoI n=1 Tax=Alkalicoccobacillus murimartini TaxID=171685 RepID=A0ABT9YP67_9BACI|nr:PepSY domain-containing protein [Alkalicoccobacillus murimartini]MDQ0208992.1 putative membrane protein YkoI [Alkalicoccobacillus murimartini]
MIRTPLRIILLITSLILVAGVVVFFFLRPTDPSISLDDVREMIVTQYGNEPTEIRYVDGVYYASIQRDDGLYEIEISEETGTILSLVPIEEDENEPTPDDSTETTEQLTKNDAKQRITELIPQDADIKNLMLVNGSPPVWKAEIEADQGDGEIEIHAESGDELSNTLPAPDDSPEQSTYITEERAIDIALNEVNGVVDDVDFEDFNGRKVYEVEVEITETDEDVTVIIDAITGQIIQFEY